ncbi:hypothetical protein L1987_59075 [Smallanthus sonchifolius]|uniref:Uncharacterized protein n=1 Tax=Smallanthus sonchifolius TaxID=185202 RepID=A0ACB9D4L3_9ASTR|nr:hypothetical protein L1987_59075 [Smallanthus sonchifolius]
MHPLSPLVLPSLKRKPDDEIPPEYKQKTMVVQETKEKPKNSATGYTIRKPETHKKPWDPEEVGKNTITIAGENKGAIMKITPFSTKKHEPGNNINITRHNPITSSNGETPDTDSQGKNKNQNSNPLMKTSFLNCNVQGVNNSILYNCSINHHDPGIRLVLSTKSDHGDFRFDSEEHKK